MRKSVQIVFTVLMTLVLVVVNFQMASAKKIEPTTASIGDPTVTFVSGDKDFTTDVVSTADIKGTTTLDSGMLVPVGFPAGEKQFEGSALMISNFDQGKITLCFPFAGKSVGWGGSVGYWNGSAWQMLDTAISTPEESNISWACATATANGQYAFLKWVVDASLLPKVEKPACTFTLDKVWLVSDVTDIGSADMIAARRNIHLKMAYVMTNHDLSGVAGRITFLSAVPDGSVTFEGKTKNVLLANDTYTKFNEFGYSIPFVKPIEVVVKAPIQSMNLRFDFPTCYINYTLEGAR